MEEIPISSFFHSFLQLSCSKIKWILFCFCFKVNTLGNLAAQGSRENYWFLSTGHPMAPSWAASAVQRLINSEYKKDESLQMVRAVLIHLPADQPFGFPFCGGGGGVLLICFCSYFIVDLKYNT